MFDLKFHAANQRLHITVKQDLDFCEYRIALVRFLKDNPDALLRSALWDLTHVRVQAILEGDLQRMTRSIAGMGRSIDLALVVPSRATTGLGHTYLGRLRDEMESIRIFRSRRAAEQWLDERGELRSREASS